MAEPEIPARARSKRKRWTALPEPEEVTEEILNELYRLRDGIDKKLAKHNDSFMQTQVRERQRFIEKCGTRIRNLHDSVRPIVVVQLLSSEDFAVEMNFSELHTSSSKSLLTWSCTDGSMADSSWRTVLQQCAEGVAAPLPRTIRATSKGSSPRAASSTPIAEPPGHPKLTSFPEAGDIRGVPIEYVEGDEDLLSASEVTVSKPRKLKMQESPPAPLTHELPSIGERKAPAGRGRPTKRSIPRARAPRWSQQEYDIIRNFCYGKDEANGPLSSLFWNDVAAQLPGRTRGACFCKWRETGGGLRKEKKKTADSPGARSTGTTPGQWSEEELRKLAQYCSQQPRKDCDGQYRKRLRGGNFEILNETQPGAVSVSAADGELVQEKMTAAEGEGDNSASPNERARQYCEIDERLPGGA